MKSFSISLTLIVVISLFFVESNAIATTMNIDLDLREAKDHSANVIIRIPQVTNFQALYSWDKKSEMEFSHLNIFIDGKKIPHKKQTHYYLLKEPLAGELIYSYRVKPGKLGRHGRQGFINGRFASFDGRIFLLPQNMETINHIVLKHELPPTWRAVNAFISKRGVTNIRSTEELPATLQLKNSAYAFGSFQTVKRQFGKTKVSVNTPAYWDKKYQKSLQDKSFRLYQYFYQHYAFSPVPNYIITWTPRSDDDKKVFGSSWSNGVQFEMPKDRFRNWELLAHRIAHAMNKYRPSGFHINRREDRWFNEGWASYVEIVATARAGIANNQYRWNHLYQRYLKTLQKHPEWDLPLTQEAEADSEATEYLHYIKAPLIVKMLEFYLQNNHNCSISKFMRFVYQKHGHFQSAFSIKHELQQFCNTNLDLFWQKMVRQPSYVVPVWQEREQLKIKPTLDYPIVIGNWNVNKNYIKFLGKQKHVDNFEKLMDLLVQQANLRQANNIQILPNQLKANLDQYPARIQYLSYQLLQHWFAQKLPRQKYGFNKTSKTSGILAAALQQEAKYHSQLVKNEVKYIKLRVNNKPTLSFSFKDNLNYKIRWMQGGMNIQAQLISPSGKIFERYNQFIQAHWNVSYINFVKTRPKSEGLWTLRVLHNGRVLASRGFWQVD